MRAWWQITSRCVWVSSYIGVFLPFRWCRTRPSLMCWSCQTSMVTFSGLFHVWLKATFEEKKSPSILFQSFYLYVFNVCVCLPQFGFYVCFMCVCLSSAVICVLVWSEDSEWLPVETSEPTGLPYSNRFVFPTFCWGCCHGNKLCGNYFMALHDAIKKHNLLCYSVLLFFFWNGLHGHDLGTILVSLG